MVSFEVGRVSARVGTPIFKLYLRHIRWHKVEEGKGVRLDPESDPQAALNLKACADEKNSYFRVNLPDGRVVMWLIDSAGRSFSLQFGR